MYQIFVKGLDGRTKCLQLSAPHLAASDLKDRLFDLIKVPRQFQSLITGTRQLIDDALLVAAHDGLYPQVHLLLRLRGGKGGFGSLLRGAATKAGQKKTSNFDACRDMSGRRFCQVNAKKKLEEWKADAQERQLKKIAEDYLKKQAKILKKSDPRTDEGARDLEKYRTKASRTMEAVESAVKDGLQEALKLQQNGKRKKIEDPQPVIAKRAKSWILDKLYKQDISPDLQFQTYDAGVWRERTLKADEDKARNLQGLMQRTGSGIPSTAGYQLPRSAIKSTDQTLSRTGSLKRTQICGHATIQKGSNPIEADFTQLLLKSQEGRSYCLRLWRGSRILELRN